MSGADFTEDQLRSLLTELGDRLQSEGFDGDIRLVGGAAIVFAGDSRRLTRDVDASYAPKVEVERITALMAEEHDLPIGWFNDNSKAFIPDGATWVSVDLPGGSRFRRASDRTLLAMKVAAERDKDIPDISFLSRSLNIGDPDEIVDIAFEQYGEESMALASTRENYLVVAEEALVANGGSMVKAERTWVEPHSRKGTPVAGHWRKRRKI